MTTQNDFSCPFCGGPTTKKRVTYTDDGAEPVVIVRGVPAQVCDQCGEPILAGEVAAQLSEMVGDARMGREGQEGIVELRAIVLETT